MRSHSRTASIARSFSIAILTCIPLAGCADLSFTRQTETSGTFRSTGFGFTIFSVDIPKGALMIARENASDANVANMQVTGTTVFPYLGFFDWLIDIVGVRWAKVEGTWGYPGR